jgi:hypothetical protein
VCRNAERRRWRWELRGEPPATESPSQVACTEVLSACQEILGKFPGCAGMPGRETGRSPPPAGYSLWKDFVLPPINIPPMLICECAS